MGNRSSGYPVTWAVLFSLFFPAILWTEENEMTREEVTDRMQPYSGEHVEGVDTSTLTGKVMCGYQGWFAAEGDGSGRGWFHYATHHRRFEPGYCTFDLWLTGQLGRLLRGQIPQSAKMPSRTASDASK